jgi:hypothetical protein
VLCGVEQEDEAFDVILNGVPGGMDGIVADSNGSLPSLQSMDFVPSCQGVWSSGCQQRCCRKQSAGAVW